MSRDIGIRNLLPGVRSVNEIKEDEKAKKDIQILLEQRTQMAPEVDPLVNYFPTDILDLSSKPVEKTKETEEAKEARELRSAINTNRIVSQVDKLAKKYDGPSQEDTINQLNKLKSWAQPTPVGLGNKYKSDTRSPNQKKRDAYVEKKRDQAKFRYNNTTGTFRNKLDQEKGMMDAHRSNEGNYIPWHERMAQEEAEALNEVKRTAWETGGKVRPEPKYVTAQDVKNVYQPKATPLQEKKLHQRLRNHNERTGQFKNLPKEEELHPYEQYHEERIKEIIDGGKSITLPLIDPSLKKKP